MGLKKLGKKIEFYSVVARKKVSVSIKKCKLHKYKNNRNAVVCNDSKLGKMSRFISSDDIPKLKRLGIKGKSSYRRKSKKYKRKSKKYRRRSKKKCRYRCVKRKSNRKKCDKRYKKKCYRKKRR